MTADLRGWTEVAPFARRPDGDALRRSRQNLRFTCAGPPGAAATRLVAAFRSSSGRGDALVAAFDVGGIDEVAHWYLSRNRFVEFGFTGALLRSPALAARLPALVPDDVPDEGEVRRQHFDDRDSFFEASPLGLISGMAWRLGFGPSRTCPALRGPHSPEALASDFVAEVVGGRFADFRVDRCAVGWSSWFHHACWDDSWVITDKRHRRVTLLCSTDTE